MFSVDDWSFEEALDGYSSWSHYSQQRTVTQFSAHSHWRPWTFWLCPTCLLRLLECITKTSSGRSFPGLPQPSSSPPSNYAGRTGPAMSGETIKQPCLFIHFLGSSSPTSLWRPWPCACGVGALAGWPSYRVGPVACDDFVAIHAASSAVPRAVAPLPTALRRR